MTALGDAAVAILVLQAGLRRGYPTRALPGATDAIAALDRLSQSGVVRPLLLELARSLRDGDVAPAEVADALEDIGEAALDEVIAAVEIAAFVSRASRPASPPPPSGRGDEEAVELRAARDATGDTLPPSGEVELGEMACCGADTEPPASVQWWDELPTVRC